MMKVTRFTQYSKVKTHWIVSTIAVFLTGAIFFSNSAQADAMSMCNKSANAINQSTPKQIDQITVLQNVLCAPSTGKPTLTYQYALDVSPGTLSQEDINALRTRQLNSWCTNPDMKFTFKLVDVTYVYNDSTGRYIGEINLSFTECPD